MPGATTTNGAQVQLWDCLGSSNQRWTHTASRQLMVYGNKCFDVNGAGTSNGTTVIIWSCHGGTNQQSRSSALGTSAPSAQLTTKFAIMAMSSCSRLWQWKTYLPW
ncbi:ricin-type beta-trefoil lectin domain protein [Micromonospora sp. NPDC005979]|uniref:ricin-type beta-trefoil lectin domain protein n=1 Tax=Micromonospora sp. NPDC005979 TaxID=3156726 RepID=UPI0033B82A09